MSTVQMPPQPQVDLIRPDKLFESLRFNEYSSENGMGEIVDNSVEAGATCIDVRITRAKQYGRGRPKTKVAEIAVADNGCGMNDDVLSKCLALGESIRSTNQGKRGIGRFGVGMTLGSISLACRVEVYSRTSPQADFRYTYIDLNEIKNGKQLYIPVPISQSPAAEYEELLKEQSGTIVLLKNCDRVEGDLEGLANYLGRTYRKFIERGIKITLGFRSENESAFKVEQVYLHDPLYMAGPTKFDMENRRAGKPMDPKAADWGTIRIPKEIEGRPGETADIMIRLSLLPEEWRKVEGAGGSPEARKRKIHENEGISILRADREVLYGHVPFITGVKGAAKAQDIDRFWGCEISVPPELDSYFQVRYIKRGAEPIESLKEQIRTEIMQYISSARKVIREDFAKNEAAASQEKRVFEAAENAMADISHSLPTGVSAKNMTPSEEESALDLTAKESLETKRPIPEEQREAEEQKKEELRSKPYSVEPVSFPRSFFFETVHTPKSLIIKLNVAHPFYEKIMKPLAEAAESAENQLQNKKTWDALLILLFAYAKAETMFGADCGPVFEQLRTQWGATLCAVIEDMYKTGKSN